MEKRMVVHFYELDEEWQKEAINNLGEYAEGTYYLEPKDGQTPDKHILWDLSECNNISGTHNGFQYNAGIAISNNSAMLLRFDDAMEEAEILFV